MIPSFNYAVQSLNGNIFQEEPTTGSYTRFCTEAKACLQFLNEYQFSIFTFDMLKIIETSDPLKVEAFMDGSEPVINIEVDIPNVGIKNKYSLKWPLDENFYYQTLFLNNHMQFYLHLSILLKHLRLYAASKVGKNYLDTAELIYAS